MKPADSFLKPLAVALFAATCLAAAPVPAQDTADLAIGVAAPLSGPYAILGRQVATGAATAAQALSAAGGVVRTLESDTRCTTEGGAAVAETFVRERVAIAVGFLCAPALEAALPVLTEAGIPVIDVGVRVDRITDTRAKTGALVWRVAPRSDAEAAALADYVAARWTSAPYGILEDGSVYGRDLADAVRDRLEERGIPPTLVDNFRPAEEKQFALARRIAQSGVTNLLVLGTRSDVAVIARDALSLGLALTLVGGEALVDDDTSDITLPDGIVALASAVDVTPPVERRSPPPSADEPPPPEGYFEPAAAAVEIAAEAVRRGRADKRATVAVLNADEFATRLGPVRFDAKGDGAVTRFRPYISRGGLFVPQTGN